MLDTVLECITDDSVSRLWGNKLLNELRMVEQRASLVVLEMGAK